MTRPICYMGVGHDRSATSEDVLALVTHCLQLAGRTMADLAAIASIEAKAPSSHIDGLGGQFNVAVRYFNAIELEAQTPRLQNPSEVVFRALGCHGVAEAAALAAAGPGATLILPKTKSRGVTCAIARCHDLGR